VFQLQLLLLLPPAIHVSFSSCIPKYTFREGTRPHWLHLSVQIQSSLPPCVLLLLLLLLLLKVLMLVSVLVVLVLLLVVVLLLLLLLHRNPRGRCLGEGERTG